jgi:DNA-binding NarL/FixJ family response regulator
MKATTNRNVGKARQRILIVDDHPMMRHGLSQLINREPDLLVCGEAGNAQEALGAIPNCEPNLVLADIAMPGKSGIELIKDLRVLHPNIAVLVMSMYEEVCYAERVLRAGGHGYVMKSEGGEKILVAIRQVLQGRRYLSPSMAAAVLEGLSKGRSRGGETALGALTDREFEVFHLIGQGLSTAEIGDQLHLSVKTIGTHRVHIKEKLNLKTSTELMKQAMQWESKVC